MNKSEFTEPMPIKDAMEKFPEVREAMEKMSRGEINVCGCMGPMYGEPYCPCEMQRKGLSMDDNPLRIADRKQSDESMKRAIEPGGWLQKMRGKK